MRLAGLGALIGPIATRWLTDGSPRTMRRAIAVAFFISAAFYVLLPGRRDSSWRDICGGAHAGSIQWVFSTTLLQLSVPNRFLGRVFALELALVTLTMSVSTYLTGWALDNGGMGPRRVAMLLGLSFLIPACAG
jgi:hypothetical protein